jgi:hypothetical protein
MRTCFIVGHNSAFTPYKGRIGQRLQRIPPKIEAGMPKEAPKKAAISLFWY